MSDEFVLDTPTVRRIIDRVRAALGGAPPRQALETLRPAFAELLRDADWLPTRYREPAAEGGMGGIAGWLRKPTLYHLFSMHATGRGTRVQSREEAETTFDLFEGTVTAFDTGKIMAEFMTNGPDQSQTQDAPVVSRTEQGTPA